MIQVTQFASGIATGQPILMSLIQQGHQVVDSSLAMGTGFSGIATAAKGMLSAIGGIPTLIGVAIVGSLTAATFAADHHQSQLAILSQQLRATRDDYATWATGVDAAARQVAASTNIGMTAALQSAQAIGSSKYFSGTSSDIKRLVVDANDLATVLGVTLAEATAKITGGLTDTSAAAHQLADAGLRTLTPELMKQIDLLQRAGQYSQSYTLFLGAIEGASKGAAKASETDLGRALDGLKEAFTGAKTGGESFAVWLGGGMLSALTAAVQAVTALVNGINAIGPAMKSVSAAAPMLDNDNVPIAGTGRASAGPAFGGTGTGGQLSVSDYNAMRDEVAAQVGVDKQLLALLNRTEGVRNPDGTWQTSSSGAVGGFQLLPGTFGDMKKAHPDITGDITDDRSNALAGGYYYRDQLTKEHGQATAAYYDYHDGPGRTGASQAAISAATTGGIAAYQGTVTTAAATPDMVDNTKKLNDQLKDQVANTRAIKDQQLDKDLAAIDTQMKQVAASSGMDSAEYQGLVQRAQELTAAKYNNVSAQEAANREEQSGIRASAGLTGAEQALNAELEKRRQIALSTGAAFGDTEQAEALANVYAKSAQELERLGAQQVRSAANSTQLTQAYDTGNQAVVDVTASTAAYNTLLDHPVAPENYRKELEALTDGYKLSKRAADEMATSQQNAQSRDSLAYIQTETDTLGMNEAQRDKLLATMKAEQDMHRKFGDVLPQEAKDYVALSGQIAESTAAYQAQQAAMQELSGFATQTFDTISQAITSAMATGSLKTVDFGNVFKSVISSVLAEIAKLAILNPILNQVFGKNETTLSSVGGALGSLLGNGSSSGGIASLLGSAASGGSSNWDGSSQGSAVNDNSTSGGLLGHGTGVLGSSVSGSDLLSGITTVAALGSLAAGKSSGVSGSQVLSLAGYAYKAAAYAFPQTTASITAGVTNYATSTANSVGSSLGLINASGDGVSAAGATAGQTVSIAAADEFASATGSAATAASQLADAIPYLGVAISLVTDLVQGNLRGAAFIATGAAAGAVAGTYVFPGVGTAIGAAIGAVVGGLVDTFFPQHPKNPYGNTQLDVQDGKLGLGTSVSQLVDTSGTQAAAQQFADGLNTFLDTLHLTITNVNGVVGNIGENIKGLNQITSPDQVLPNLRFGSTDPTSNFGIAAGGDLTGKSFATVDQFTAELQKIADFSDRMTGIGVQLAAVSTDFQNIHVSSVSNPTADGSDNDFYTALNADLPKQNYADENALDAEVEKVNQFVHGTLPSLLNPVIQQTVSEVQAGVQAIYTQYQNATTQAEAYGLSIAGLAQAADEAVQQYIAPAVKALNQSTASIQARGLAASGDQEGSDLLNFDIKSQQEQDAYSKSITDVYGQAAKSQQFYADAMLQLEETEGAERLAIVQKYALQIAAADAGINTTLGSFWTRQIRAAAGSNGSEQADLMDFDASASQQIGNFAASLVAAYGGGVVATQGFADDMLLQEQTLATERLAIIQKYAAQAVQLEQGVSNTLESFWTRQLRAIGGTGNNEQADLMDFDTSAVQQRQSLSDQLKAAYGNDVTGTQGYADDMALLEQTLGVEKNAIYAKYTAQVQQSAQSILDTLSGAVSSDLTANASLSGGTSEAADLYGFDISAAKQKSALNDQLVAFYGAAASSTSAYAENMATLDQSLADQRLAIQKKYDDQTIAAQKQASQSVLDTLTGAVSADMRAQASASGGTDEAADLYDFDISSDKQRAALNDQLVALYGATASSTSAYAENMTTLEQSLADQRLGIQKKYADQALAAQKQAESPVASNITSISSFLRQLQFGDASPLSPGDQLSLAQSQFQAVSSAAQAGNTDSLGQFQSYAQDYLTAARSYYASGSGYVDAVNQIEQAASALANSSADALTADAMARIAQANIADPIVSALGDLKDQLAALAAENKSLRLQLTGLAAA